MFRKLAFLPAVLLLAGGFFLVAQVPGSKENPLISRKFADTLYKFNVYSFPEGTRITLEAGTEVILRAGKARIQGRLLNLTKGQDETRYLTPNHYYLAIRAGEKLEFSSPSILLLKGRWD